MNTTNTTRRAVNKSKKNAYKPTLDVQHTCFLNTIQEMSKMKDTLMQDLAVIDRDLGDVENRMREFDIVDDAHVQEFTRLKDRRIEILDELKKISSNFDEQSYYTNTASILFEYYDLVEKGHSHSASEKPQVSVNMPPPVKVSKPAGLSILDYFKCSQKKGDIATPPKNEASAPTPCALPNVDGNTNTNKSRGALLTRYMKYTDPDYTKNVQDQALCTEECCQHCGSSKVMIMTNDGYTWCTNCDAVEYIIIDHEKPSYRDPPKEISFFAYKRSNHLNEWISQIQGKETTEIPEEVYDKILMEIKKQKITNMAEITPKKIKQILKSLQIHKYYEHSAHIINRMTGIPMKQLSPELEEQLRSMFKMIQTPFLKHAPKSRKNFLSYSFVLHKLIQLLGKDEYLDNFPLLKSREKLYNQDIVWRKICEEVNWEFYPSI